MWCELHSDEEALCYLKPLCNKAPPQSLQLASVSVRLSLPSIKFANKGSIYSVCDCVDHLVSYVEVVPFLGSETGGGV